MDSSHSSFDEYQLGPFKIKGKQNTLETTEEEIVVLPKVMAMLLHLCRHSQQVVTFDELNNAIWPQEVVGDNAIYNLVGQLRKALGDSAKNPTYVQTVSKVGYRLKVNATPIKPPILKSSKLEKHTPVDKETSRPWLLPVALVMLIIVAAAVIFSENQNFSTSPEYQRQLKLAHYQLYRGDGQGVDQAITTLQQLIATEPQADLPKVELAYAFLRKAKVDPDNNTFWLSKAQAISTHKNLNERGARLAKVASAFDDPSFDLNLLTRLFTQDEILTSARMAYSQLLFDRGNIKQASEQLQMAIDTCLDCPYIYRRFATTQIVLGNIQEGFDSFSHYRMLINQGSNNPSDNAGYVPLTMQSLREMANWLFKNPIPSNLLPHQRNSLALFYLSLGNINAAETTVETEADSSTQFFDLYTHAAIAGAKGEFEKAYTLLKKRQQLFPENERFKLSEVFALWQLGRYKEAMQRFDEHQILVVEETLPDNMPFSTWSLYAALLLKTGDKALGEQILASLENQLSAGLVQGSQLADIRLASVLALQGNEQKALDQLQIAISQGWVSDFNQNWWYIQDSPYFSSLQTNERFKRIVADYHNGVETELKTARLNQ